jgi:hypothetical protein
MVDDYLLEILSVNINVKKEKFSYEYKNWHMVYFSNVKRSIDSFL